MHTYARPWSSTARGRPWWWRDSWLAVWDSDLELDLNVISDIYLDGLHMNMGQSDQEDQPVPPLPKAMNTHRSSLKIFPENLLAICELRQYSVRCYQLSRTLNCSHNWSDKSADPMLDPWTWAPWRLKGMQSMLLIYTNSSSHIYDLWRASLCQAAIGMGRGHHCAHRLWELCRDFINDQMVIPINPLGDWNKFMLINENLQNEIDIYLMSIRNEISAQKTHNSWNFFINLTFGIECNISHKTACQYLHTHYKATLKGQYADGHERADVMFYWDNFSTGSIVFST